MTNSYSSTSRAHCGFLRWATSVALGLALCGPAGATVVNGSFAGLVTSAVTYMAAGQTAFGTPDPNLVIGTAVTGTFSYDTAGAIDKAPSANIGNYQNLTGYLNVDAGSYSYRSSGPLIVLVRSFAGYDRIVLTSLSNDGNPNNAYYAFVEVSHTVDLGGDALPTSWSQATPGSPSGVSMVRSPLGLPDGTMLGYEYAFTTTSAQAAATVPEPAGYATMLMGLAALGIQRRRRAKL